MKSIGFKTYGKKLEDSKFSLGQLVHFKDDNLLNGKKDLQVVGVIIGISKNKFEGKDYYKYEVQSNLGHYILCDENILNIIDDDVKITIK